MDKSFRRPSTKNELDDREVAGLWKAIALAQEIGESDEHITLDTILRVHRTMFGAIMPEIAGRFRVNGEDVKKLKCIEPPPGRLVREHMYAFWRELDAKLSVIPRHPKRMTTRNAISRLSVRLICTAIMSLSRCLLLKAYLRPIKKSRSCGRENRQVTNTPR